MEDRKMGAARTIMAIMDSMGLDDFEQIELLSILINALAEKIRFFNNVVRKDEAELEKSVDELLSKESDGGDE